MAAAALFFFLFVRDLTTKFIPLFISNRRCHFIHNELLWRDLRMGACIEPWGMKACSISGRWRRIIIRFSETTKSISSKRAAAAHMKFCLGPARRSKLAQLWKILKQHFLNDEREPIAQNLHDVGASGGINFHSKSFFEICQDRKAMTHRDRGCVNFA